MSPITFQIQLEPDSVPDLNILHKRMIDFILAIESHGYVRFQMCVGLNVVQPGDENVASTKS